MKKAILGKQEFDKVPSSDLAALGHLPPPQRGKVADQREVG